MILTPKEISYLSASFKGQNPLSPFSNITETPDGNEYDSLCEKGIIVNNGYDEKALDMLQRLTNPEMSASLVIQSDFYLVQKFTYKTGDRLILAENQKGALKFSESENFADVLTDIYKCVGMSDLPTAHIAGVFTPEELLVFFALVDIYRKNTLAGYVEGENPEIKIGESDILNTFSDGYANGLAKTILESYNLKVPDAAELGNVLNPLKERGYIETETDIKLTQVYEIFARNFLIPKKYILHEMLELGENGNILAESSMALSAGIHDIVSLIFDGENFLLTTPSAAELARSILITLSCLPFKKEEEKEEPEKPEAAASPAAPDAAAPEAQHQTVTAQPAPAQPADGSWKCSCGNVNDGNFCIICGSKRP
ncbi:MAG: hypothetical protein GX897_06885 [Clostridiales bacterium]|nr:hypothetical protein [Clostridiales bacterium]